MTRVDDNTAPESCHRPCIVCGGESFEFLFSKGGRDFFQCEGCGHQRQHPLPTQDDLDAFYEKSYQDGLYLTFSEAEKLKALTAQHRLKKIKKACHVSGTWLDVGASTGAFCEAMANSGIDAEGLEISETAVKTARDNGLSVRQGRVEDLPESHRFDGVTAFDVIEHVRRPADFLSAMKRTLKPGGTLVLTLPNLRSVSRSVLRARWYFYIPEEHLHYFDKRTIRRLLERNGFTCLSTKVAAKPMTFNYAQTQLKEYNPGVFRVTNALGKLVPARLKAAPIPLPLGEMCIVARVRDS